MKVASSNTSAVFTQRQDDEAAVLKPRGDGKSNKTSTAAEPVEDRRPTHPGNGQSATELMRRAEHVGDLSRYVSPARLGVEAADRPTSAAERVNVDLNRLYDGAIVQTGRDATPAQVGNGPVLDSLLQGTPGGPLGQSATFQAPFEQLQEENAQLADLLQGQGHPGRQNTADNEAAENNLLNNWGNQHSHNPFANGTPVTNELTGRFGSRTPQIGGDPAQRNLQYVSNGDSSNAGDTENASGEGQQANPSLSDTDIAGLVASALTSIATGLAKGLSSALTGIGTGLGLTILTAPTNPEDNVSALGVFGKWANGEGATMGSQAQGMADLKKKGSQQTERTTGEEVGGNAITQETIDRFNARRGGLVNPGTDANEIDRAEAAARILQGKEIADQSVIRTTGEDAGQTKPKGEDIQPRDTGLTNPSDPFGPPSDGQPDIARPEPVPDPHGGSNPVPAM